MSKASKMRPCPALDRGISPADCGEQRQSRLACPETCPHNPFAPGNYSQLLDIEDRLNPKIMARLAALAPDRAALDWEIDHAERKGGHAIHALFAWKLFFETGADQATFAGRWEQSGLAELKNDERVLQRAKMRMRIAVLEAHRVFEGGRVEVVDLLSRDPMTMLVQDRSLAGMASRFTTLLSWIYPLPHYWRLSGTAVIIPDVRDFSAPEVVHEIVRHLGGPVTEPEMRRWLAEHFVEFDAARLAVTRLRHQQMIAGMDAKFGKAVYELRSSFAQCRDRLDALPEVRRDDLSEKEKDDGFAEARAWFDQFPNMMQRTLPDGKIVLGRILLGQSHWRLEAFGAERLSRLRLQFEQHLGDLVRFSGERVEDLGARMTAGLPAVDESLAPPRLLEDPEKLLATFALSPAPAPGVSPEAAESEWMSAADHAFLEEEIPDLSNRTPREASRDPALRPKLVRLMKLRVRSRDEHNLKTGRTDDINWLLRELNLHEIDFDPPLWRPPAEPLERGDADWPEPPEDYESAFVDPNRPPPPPLPNAPIEFDEAIDRIETGIGLFETAALAEEELYASGATILDDACELTMGLVSENDFSFAVSFVMQAWFALVPPGCRAPEIDFDDLEESFDSNLRHIESCVKEATPKKMESFFQSSPQPGLMLALLGGFVHAAETAPKEFRPAPGAHPVILALLKSVVEKLDEALRGKFII